MTFPSFITPRIFPAHIPVLGMIHWYGLMYLLGIFIVFLMMRHYVKKGYMQIPLDDKGGLFDYLFYIVIGIIGGARLGYFAFYHPADFIRAPWEILGFHFRSGGPIVAHYLIAIWFLLIAVFFVTPLWKALKTGYNALEKKDKNAFSTTFLITALIAGGFIALGAAMDIAILFALASIACGIGVFAAYLRFKQFKETNYAVISLITLTALLCAFGIATGVSLMRGHFLYFGFSGMSFHGGMLGVIAATFIFAKRFKYPYLRLMDFSIIPVPLALFFGRLGNFINCELYGRVATGRWEKFGMRFPDYDALPGGADAWHALPEIARPYTEPRFPSQLYEAFLEGLLLFVIVLIVSKLTRNKKNLNAGITAWTFVAGYGLFRFLVEFVRDPNEWTIGWFTAGMAYSLPMFFIGAGIIVYLLATSNKKTDAQ